MKTLFKQDTSKSPMHQVNVLHVVFKYFADKKFTADDVLAMIKAETPALFAQWARTQNGPFTPDVSAKNHITRVFNKASNPKQQQKVLIGDTKIETYKFVDLVQQSTKYPTGVDQDGNQTFSSSSYNVYTVNPGMAKILSTFLVSDKYNNMPKTVDVPGTRKSLAECFETYFAANPSVTLDKVIEIATSAYEAVQIKKREESFKLRLEQLAAEHNMTVAELIKVAGYAK